METMQQNFREASESRDKLRDELNELQTTSSEQVMDQFIPFDCSIFVHTAGILLSMGKYRENCFQVKSLEEKLSAVQTDKLTMEKENQEMVSRSEDRLHVVNMQLENVQKLLAEALEEKSSIQQGAERTRQTLQVEIEELNEAVHQVWCQAQ